MADLTKNIVALLTFILFLIGTGVTILGIFKSDEAGFNQISENYIIPSQVLNGLTVMFLLYLTATNTSFSATYKLLIIFLLVGGMLIEIYLTNYLDKKADYVFAYMFVVLNFLIRAFFLVDLAQSEWVTPIKPVQQAVKASVMKPLEEAIKEVAKPISEAVSKPEASKKPEPSNSAWPEIQSKWDKLRKMLEAKPEGLNKDTEREAWKNIISPTKTSDRKDVKEILREAVGKMKDKDGKPIPLNSVDAIGGKRS